MDCYDTRYWSYFIMGLIIHSIMSASPGASKDGGYPELWVLYPLAVLSWRLATKSSQSIFHIVKHIQHKSSVFNPDASIG